MQFFLNYISIPIAYAADQVSPVAVFVGKVNRILINPIIILLFAAGLVYFLYGVLEFLINADQEEARTQGKSHMLWGIVGMFIMFGVFAILRLIESTLGIPHNVNLQ